MSEELSKDNTGEVIWFSKGIGFIARANGLKDIFVHYSHVKMEGYKTLKPGQKVKFDFGENDKGIIATNVVVIGEPDENYDDGKAVGFRSDEPDEDPALPTDESKSEVETV